MNQAEFYAKQRADLAFLAEEDGTTIEQTARRYGVPWPPPPPAPEPAPPPAPPRVCKLKNFQPPKFAFGERVSYLGSVKNGDEKYLIWAWSHDPKTFKQEGVSLPIGSRGTVVDTPLTSRGSRFGVHWDHPAFGPYPHSMFHHDVDDLAAIDT